MFCPKKIIVGVRMPESRPWDAANLGPDTRLAIRQAFGVAGELSSTVSMVSVLQEAFAGIFSSEEEARVQSEQDQREALTVLDDLEQQYANQSDTSVKTESAVVFGKPWFEILKAANDSRRNLIISGVRDRSAVSRLLFGSTGLKLLRNAECPVWLLKPRIDDDADLDVLAATDLSDVGEDILFTAVAVGQSLPVRLNVLHVIDNHLDREMVGTGTYTDQLAECNQQIKTEAQDKLHHQLSLTDYRTVEKGVQVHIAEGSPDACILNAIDELDIDLLIMATAARGGIPGMLFGNTAERLLPQLPCSVLVLKPDDFRSPISLD